jgi:Asp-tRNA(Asn)/Glu-tRNA(Gln) amidotransferase A subunit family amidase
MSIRAHAAACLCLTAAALSTPAAQPPSSRASQPAPIATFDVLEKSIEDLQRAMGEGRVTSRQLVAIYLARIEAYNTRGPSLNAIMAVNPLARDAAAALDAERASGRISGPLHGIPVLVKDNYETIEMPTTAGSIALATFHPASDAVQVQRLKAAGAVILGKTTMHELAAGIVTVGSGFGRTRNPYDLDRNPGGSSGGTGAAIAANLAVAGMGSDTCGSIRNPASQNNLVGLRGTQGLSSRTGIVPLSSTQDIGGPLARSIEDLAILLDATVGSDPADPPTAVAEGHVPRSYRAALREDALKGARIGVVRGLFGAAPEDQEVTTIVNRALEAWTKAGADVSDVVIPGLDELLRNSSMIASDFKFDLADYLMRAENPPVKSLGEILDRGLYHAALESTFRMRNAVEQRENDASRRAQVKRVAIRQAVEAVLAEHRLTALVYPTLRRKPALIGEPQPGSSCQLSAHSGLPALAIPAGFTSDGLPVGLELLGGAWTEPDLLSLGYASQQILKLRRTPFSTPALVDGRAPAHRSWSVSFAPSRPSAAAPSRIVVNLTWDRTTSRLGYELKADPATLKRISAVWIHAGTTDKPGAARQRLFAQGWPGSGMVLMSFADREALSEGRLIVRLFVRGVPGSAGDIQLSIPGDSSLSERPDRRER